MQAATHRPSSWMVRALQLIASIRGYNIVVVCLAQVLTAAFIMGAPYPILHVLLDGNLWGLIIATAASIAGGYIVNNFYDREKDLINRPRQTLLEHGIRRNTLWQVYFALNFIAVGVAALVSLNAALFFSGFIALLWYYSHKIKRFTLVGNLVAAAIAVLPLFAIFIYYKNFNSVILVHGSLLYMIILLREWVKDLENLRGDLAAGYHTIPVSWGIKTSKVFYTIVAALTLVPVSLLLTQYDVGRMDYYFVFCLTCLVITVPLLWSSRYRRHYLIIHNLLKAIIVIGVLCIVLIGWDALIARL